MTANASPTPDSSTNAKATLATATAVVLWASAFVGIRSAGHDYSPGPLALARFLVGAVPLGVMVLIRREKWPARRDLPGILVCGLLWQAVYNVALNAAERRLDAGTSAMLIGIGPVLIALIAGVGLREGLPRPLLLALPVSFGGVLLIGFSSSRGAHSDARGVLLCLGAALAYSIALVVQKPLLKRVSALQMTFLCLMTGVVACLPFGPSLVRETAHAPGSAVAWAVYLGLMPTALAFTTWAYALARMSAGRLSITTYVVPPLSIFLGWLLLDEVPTGLALVGGALCLVGVAISRLSGRPRRDAVVGPVPEAAAGELTTSG